VGSVQCIRYLHFLPLRGIRNAERACRAATCPPRQRISRLRSLVGDSDRARLRYAVSPALLGIFYRTIEQDSAKGIVPQPSGPPSGARALFAGLCHDPGCVGVERRDLTLFRGCDARERVHCTAVRGLQGGASRRPPSNRASSFQRHAAHRRGLLLPQTSRGQVSSLRHGLPGRVLAAYPVISVALLLSYSERS
jgi:hypothetical protein